MPFVDGPNEIQIAEQIANDCAKGKDGKDLQLLWAARRTPRKWHIVLTSSMCHPNRARQLANIILLSQISHTLPKFYPRCTQGLAKV